MTFEADDGASTHFTCARAIRVCIRVCICRVCGARGRGTRPRVARASKAAFRFIRVCIVRGDGWSRARARSYAEVLDRVCAGARRSVMLDSGLALGMFGALVSCVSSIFGVGIWYSVSRFPPGRMTDPRSPWWAQSGTRCAREE